MKMENRDSIADKLKIFKSIFRGREDVFAKRWEKGIKSGYMPAYQFDPYFYRAHKIKGGNFNDFQDKTYLPFNDEQIEKHLNGVHLAGIYPLLPDNTSWFIVADFDKENWIEECRLFLKTCRNKGISANVERSRSGKGGHVWIFFDHPYPAVKSRKIIRSLLSQSGIISQFDKNSSFDRIFPNQDFLSGKGLGNLIALPLYKHTFNQGNSCFINEESLLPLQDQWQYLANLQKNSTLRLDELFIELIENGIESPAETLSSSTLSIKLDNVLRLNRVAIPALMSNFIKDELNFINSEYFIKKKAGKNTFGIEQYFKFIEETNTSVSIPKGFTGRLLRFCRENKIEFGFEDLRKKQAAVSFQFNAILREHQIIAVEAAAKKDIGVIVAPPGTGKTIIGLKIITDKQQPSLIIVHRKTLMDQWAERIEAFLGIPQHEIGKIGQGKSKIGKSITIATIQSFSKILENPESTKILDIFGTVIVDECHRIPAETYRKSISRLNSYYLYGLTATPFRKYNDGKLIFIHLGEIISEIKHEDISLARQAQVIIRNTEFDIPFNSKTDQFETLSKMLVHDSARNKLILKDVIVEIKSGKRVIIITERKEHIDSLNQFLKQSFEVITLSGDDSENKRSLKWETLHSGNYQALITTGQFFGEGTDLQNANCLFLVYPFSFKGKLIQYIGRVQRSEIIPTIYDYRDLKIDYLNRLFLKRNTWYRKLEKQATLFDDPDDQVIPFSKELLLIDKNIVVPIESLDFRYGGIAFKYEAPGLKAHLEFEVENDAIRPEFEVLKSYFSKILQSKNVSISIHAEFENNVIISQLATSADMDRINKEIIEGVRFRYFSKTFLSGSISKGLKENLLDAKQLQSGDQLYNSGEDLINDLLNRNQYKHSKYVRYLADRHAAKLLKIRFVLNPFSFVFLLTGNEQFHTIMETLDTEEATYLWHFEKATHSLPFILKEIESHLTLIRNNGRQVFLDSTPTNFSRILHDYSDEKKGFIRWKDILEERLT
jgi:superfamily II DNA or RNA helicase